MKWQACFARVLSVVMMLMMLTGCRYLSNRYYDFRDTFDIGVGITAENPVTGIFPPSLGIHAQVTDFLQLGWITHNGYSAELDMRGTFVGPEGYTRAGFFWWSMIQKNQAYDHAVYYNKFKDKDFWWCERMESYSLMKYGRPAKRLHYEFWAPYAHEGTLMLHQGWQYWGYSGLNVAISEPFLTHLGFMVRAGFDPSEVSDFLLGWFLIDFKHDDLTRDEFRQMWGLDRRADATEPNIVDATGTGSQDIDDEAMPPAGSQPAEPMRGVESLQPLATIYFDFDRSNIRPSEMPKMEQNLEYLLANPTHRVLIVGHTDERGTSEYNYNLGVRRAEVVRDYLLANGIAADRIQIQSRGEESPAVPNATTEAQHQLNRRAELTPTVMINVANE